MQFEDSTKSNEQGNKKKYIKYKFNMIKVYRYKIKQVNKKKNQLKK